MTSKFFQPNDALQKKLNQILDLTWARFPNLAQNQIAVTWLAYEPPYTVNTGGALSADNFWKQQPKGASYRGVERIYPASVIKLFYLVAIHEWLDRGMVQTSLELERALRDMIIDSSNDATGYVVDVLTGTTSGPELPPGPFETWKQQRNLINRYLTSLQWPELATINANQKTWCDGPYGRERAFLGEGYENRNMLTTEASARLLHSIIGGVAVNAERSHTMMDLMKRDLDPKVLAADPENQVTGFLGAGVPVETKVWSKAGLTSKVRHDAAYIEADGAHPYLLVVFTEGAEHSQDEEILPFVSAQILAAMHGMNT
ncbi:serine hydrolase [Leptolyngbyaceae cyanobacterium CCMR0082]|uniref:Serine hydrolase n=2 Tax=Adonisia turfae TaxID=2950184 RepID=A0A6M0SAA7_9CYAN|nr:serine hydrolase [Adonisia turfae]MDV3350799.1 serine hydrolase [Leptothoe sp. LEGE 181152]NEZ60386.1 serine hydrolase [Adonisia turfae CCMR0081]NEZ65419.1 serine hydrolase [Adonisia turfae CCMR0082]